MVFNKNKCNKCGKKIDKNSSFCPNCGRPINHAQRNVGNKKRDNYGLLGKNDLPENSPFSEMGKMPPGFNFILDKLMKKFGKEFKELSEEMQKRLMEEERMKNKGQNNNAKKMISENNLKKGLNINISSSEGQPPRIKVTSFGNNGNMMNQKLKPQEEKTENVENKEFSKKKAKTYAKLPQKEPEKNIKRFSDKIEYEISVPGVSSSEDISIRKLEESIEVKAIGKEYSYFKTIPFNLKLKNYFVEEEKIILEFKEE